MTYKINISRTGYNALTDTDPNYLIFSSDYNTLKYNTNGSVTLSGSWTTNPGDDVKTYTKTVSHSLGYKPFFVCYVNFVGNYNIIPYKESYMTIGSEIASAWVDDNNMYFDVQLRPGIWSYTWNFNFTFYYKIFRNNLGL
jgi:hypothetical protein